jgi:protocatechuate 3,4-dioxygenase beta subunit
MMFRTTVLKASLLLIPLTAFTGALALADLADPDAKQTITGNVVGPSGKAAEGVRVFYSQHEAGKTWGDVLVEVMPDPDGQIRLETPPVTGNRPYRQMGMLWAYRPGALVGTLPVFQGTNPPGVPTPLTVGPPAYTPFEVRDPDGKPVAGATIEPKGVETPGAVVPERLAKLIGEETVTDANGRAVMTAFLAEEVNSVVVTAPEYGRQKFYFGYRNITTDVKVLGLLPMTRLKGRLTGDPALIGGRELSITVANPANGGSWATSLEQATTDAEGRFEVDGLVPGYLGVSNERDINAPFYFQTEQGVMIEAGKTKEIELAPKKAVKLSGVVREKGTEKPIPGVGLVVAGPGVGIVTTDAKGRYTGFDARQPQHLLTVVEVPDGFAPPLFARVNMKFPLDADEIEMPPVELAPATSVDGLVVDTAGKPIAGADVTVFWEVDEGENRRGPTQSTVRSGLDGRFTVKRVDLGGEATLVAQHLGLRTPQAVHIKIGTKEPIRLQLDDSRSVELEGRVVDSSGKPIAGAQVHLRRAVDFNKQGAKFTIRKDELVNFGGNIILKTDADGGYQTPKQLDRESTYSAFATKPGMLSANTEWFSAGVAVFPDITLKPENGEK